MLTVLLGVFAAICWSIHDLFARSLAQRVGPFRMAALVMIAGGILLTGFVLDSKTLSGSSQSGLVMAIGLGLAYGFGAGGLCKAFSLGPISLVAPLTAIYPVLVILWGLANGLAPTHLQWTASATALAGTVVVAWDGGGQTATPPGVLGGIVFFSLLSVCGYAAAVILGQNAAVSIGEIEAAWISRPAAVLTLLPFLAGEARQPALQSRHWLGIFAMGAFDVMGLVAVNASGHLSNREFAAIGISAYGATAAILAMLFLKERVGPLQWAGIAMIVTGVATLSVSQ
jgi:drug/metabolite transporter (DMT)-like permease